jgi:hypothetical protein
MEFRKHRNSYMAKQRFLTERWLQSLKSRENTRFTRFMKNRKRFTYLFKQLDSLRKKRVYQTFIQLELWKKTVSALFRNNHPWSFYFQFLNQTPGDKYLFAEDWSIFDEQISGRKTKRPRIGDPAMNEIIHGQVARLSVRIDELKAGCGSRQILCHREL